MLQIFDGVMKDDVVFLEESVHLDACFKAEQLLNLIFGKTISPIAFQSHGFEDGTRGVFSPGCEYASQIVRDFDSNGHNSILLATTRPHSRRVVLFGQTLNRRPVEPILLASCDG